MFPEFDTSAPVVTPVVLLEVLPEVAPLTQVAPDAPQEAPLAPVAPEAPPVTPPVTVAPVAVPEVVVAPVSRLAKESAARQQRRLAKKARMELERANSIETLLEEDPYHPGEPDYWRDLQWVYKFLGQTVKKTPKAPSTAAAAMIVAARKDSSKFFDRYSSHKKYLESQDSTPDRREMIEDEQETLGQLRRLSKEIAPDVDAVLREAAALFPDQFAQTMNAMGWVTPGPSSPCPALPSPESETRLTMP